MSRQKIIILILAVIGVGSSFLPWVKGGPLIGTVVGIGSNEKSQEIFWMTIVSFLIPIVICLVVNSKFLNKALLIVLVLPPLICALFAFGILIMDLNSWRGRGFTGIYDENIRLILGPAPYLIFLTGILIPFFGFILKPNNEFNPN